MPANLTFDQKLYQSLIELNVVDKKKLDEVFKLSQTQQTAFAKLLIEKDLVTGDNLAKLTSDLIKVPLVHLPEIVIPKAVLKIIPEELARREKMIVFEEGKNGIKIAMADPQDGEIQKLITQKTGQKVILYLATEQDIDHTLSLYKEDLLKQLTSDLVKKHFQDKEEIRFYLGKGCDVCHQTGYLGRIGIFEVLEVSSSIKDLITGKANSDIILKKAVEEGMSTMMDDGLQKVVKGLTTVEEVLRATKE